MISHAMEPFDLALVERYRHRPNWKRYVALIEAAGAGRNDWAIYIMATWYLHGFRQAKISQDVRRALTLLRKASRTCPHAMMELARRYADGIGVPRSPSRSRQLLVKASQYGSVYARIHLAHLFGEGVDVRPDHARARRLMKDAARCGLEIDERERVVISAVIPPPRQGRRSSSPKKAPGARPRSA